MIRKPATLNGWHVVPSTAHGSQLVIRDANGVCIAIVCDKARAFAELIAQAPALQRENVSLHGQRN